ncbi:hypothetical protein NPIL_224561, partial [Nephila pilipes]
IKGHFSVIVALCVILLTLQSVEMIPAVRERRQSGNLVGISRGFADSLTKGILDFVEGILKNVLGGIVGS